MECGEQKENAGGGQPFKYSYEYCLEKTGNKRQCTYVSSQNYF